MSRIPRVPASLKRGHFTLADARRAGLDKWHLEGASWKRVGPATYVWAALAETPLHKLEAALKRLPMEAALSGRAAAWLHGIDVTPDDPIEVIVPKRAGVSARVGLIVRRAELDKSEVSRVRGLRATTLVRTVTDVCSRLSLTEGVVFADMALHGGGVGVEAVLAWANKHAGRPGVARLRRVLDHVEPKAESPMESRLRMILVLGGLPRPEAQVSIRDRWGRVVGRPDLYFRAHRLGVEYDGGVHRDRLVEDNRRQNRLVNAGIRLLRFTAADVLNNPDSVVAQVRAQLTVVAGSDGIRVA